MGIPNPLTARYKKAQKLGKRAEWLASFWLRLKFYRILARNWKSPYGEVDIIALKGRQLVIIEVKMRAHAGFIDHTILNRQKERLMRAALQYQQNHSQYKDYSIRFDALLISSSFLSHIKNAWWSDR